MFYKITNTLEHMETMPPEEISSGEMIAVTLHTEEWAQTKEHYGFPSYTGFEHDKILSCKAECYSKYIFGSLCIPVREHLLSIPLTMIFYISPDYIVFIDDGDLPDRIIGRMVHRYQDQQMSPEFFLFAFFQEFLNDDIELLERYENHLFALEEKALRGNTKNLLENILKARRELTRLRNYYEQMEDLSRELLSNVKNYFHTEDLQLLQPLCDRADQLQGIAQQAIEYCQTLRDFEQAQSDHKQNKTIEFLTILTSIFFPLTVITGWYGMNFTNMPEIHAQFGYLTVIFVSAAVIMAELFLLKKKRML